MQGTNTLNIAWKHAESQHGYFKIGIRSYSLPHQSNSHNLHKLKLLSYSQGQPHEGWWSILKRHWHELSKSHLLLHLWTSTWRRGSRCSALGLVTPPSSKPASFSAACKCTADPHIYSKTKMMTLWEKRAIPFQFNRQHFSSKATGLDVTQYFW